MNPRARGVSGAGAICGPSCAASGDITRICPKGTAKRAAHRPRGWASYKMLLLQKAGNKRPSESLVFIFSIVIVLCDLAGDCPPLSLLPPQQEERSPRAGQDTNQPHQTHTTSPRSFRKPQAWREPELAPLANKPPKIQTVPPDFSPSAALFLVPPRCPATRRVTLPRPIPSCSSITPHIFFWGVK